MLLDGVPRVLVLPIQLKPVKMKNSLYLLIPKGIAGLLDLDETRECVLTTETENASPVLRYSFTASTSSQSVLAGRRPSARLRKGAHIHTPRSSPQGKSPITG